MASGNLPGVVEGDRIAWFGTGGAVHARVFRSVDRGQTWSVYETPIPAAQASSGLFSLGFRVHDHGVAVGGDYKEPDKNGRVAALTSDGGRTWMISSGSKPPAGYRSCRCVCAGRIAANSGRRWSHGLGSLDRRWRILESARYDGVPCRRRLRCRPMLAGGVGDNEVIAAGFCGSFAANPERPSEQDKLIRSAPRRDRSHRVQYQWPSPSQPGSSSKPVITLPRRSFPDL